MQKNLSNKELVAAGHKFAANISADTPLIDMAKMVSALATQLDVALAAAAEAGKQRGAVVRNLAEMEDKLRIKQNHIKLRDTYIEELEKHAEAAVACTNSLTNAQEALKSAGIEADTVQAGVMELVDKLRIKQNHIQLRDTYIEELEQRAEAAEAELAEMQKQEPIYQYMTVSISDETWLQERWHDCTKEEFDDANSECAPTRIVYAQQQPLLAEGLHPQTAELVMQFAEALARKLRKSEQKYGWSDGWKDVGWQDKCLADFHHHITKGDPRDVAAYCAFMWYHGWPTQSATAIDLNAVRAEGVDMFIEKSPYVIPHRLKAALSNYANKLRADNAGKDGV